jgi:hypothetical protein
MTRPPDFDDLVGADLDEDERLRLRAVHDLLLEAGAPPELPRSLEPVPAEDDESAFPLFPRRRWAAALALAAALAAAAFGAGYLVGDRESTREPERVVAMSGAGSAAAARASLSVYGEDEAGNWPMRLTVQELPPLPGGKTYELWLTKDGELAAQCGSFATEDGTTEVPLNAPFPLSDYDGWVVVQTGKTDVLLRTPSI